MIAIWTWVPVENYEESSVRSATEQLIRMKVVNAGGDPDNVQIIWSEDLIFPDDGPPTRVMTCRGEAQAL